MKRKLTAILMVTVLVLLAAAPAMAANIFAFAERTITIFEEEEVTPVLNREGTFEEGEIEFSSGNPKVAVVSADGTVTAVGKGKSTITAALKQNGKVVRKATTEIRVSRRVTKVTLNMKNISFYEQGDPEIAGLVGEVSPEAAENPVIVIAAGKSINLSAVCTPEDATNRRVSFSSTDVGVAKIAGEASLRGVQRGECELVVASVQNPEITQVFHVVVIDPVKKITIEAPSKTIFAGESMGLDAICAPDTASIKKVTWSSRQPAVATVDENGTVTGLKKGSVSIEAKATDGSGVAGTITLKVAQDVTEIQLKQADVTVAVKRTVQVNATVLPRDADTKTLTWESSDESIATVKNGVISGKKAGTCLVTATSVSNPSVTATVNVTVVQPVTKISFVTPTGLSFPIRTSQQLDWIVEPEDATIKDVTFKSNYPKIATVDENGLVTGVSKGTATITVTATDGSNRSASYKVNITQPVEGVQLARPVYYVQRSVAGRERRTNIRATVLPKNANNQKVYWEVDDPYFATVRSNGTATGSVTGWEDGITTITAITDDGGFTASAQIQIADFDGAVIVESLQITDDNKIRISLRNISGFTISKVFFRVDCFDTMNNPMIYNTDGVSTGFDGSYPLTLQPGERTTHGQFNFGQFMDTGTLGAVILTVTGYQFDNGQTWEIPAEYRIPSQPYYSRYMWTPTPAPLLPEEPAVPEGETNG